MILVDTSVWIDHLRGGEAELVTALERQQMLTPPFVIGEFSLLRELPTAVVASEAEVLSFIERRSLMGRGIGYLDVHLLASVALEVAQLWTRDKRLAAAAKALDVAFIETR